MAVTPNQPTSLGFIPLGEIELVINFFRGGSGISWIDAAKAATEVIRFGLDLLSTQPQVLAATATPMTEDQTITELEDMVQAEQAQQPRAVDGSIWAALLPVLGQILAGWLAKRGQKN